MPRLHDRRTFQASALFSNVNRLWISVGYVAAMLPQQWTSCGIMNRSVFVLASRRIYQAHVLIAQVKRSTGKVPGQHVPVDQAGCRQTVTSANTRDEQIHMGPFCTID